MFCLCEFSTACLGVPGEKGPGSPRGNLIFLLQVPQMPCSQRSYPGPHSCTKPQIWTNPEHPLQHSQGSLPYL